MDKFQILKSKIGIFLRENLEAPLYVEYLSQKSDEVPFEKQGKKWEFVWAKYPDGKRDIGVYSFSEDLVYAYQPWRKMVGIDKGGDTVGASMYDRHFKSDLKEENPITTDDIEMGSELDFADEATEPDYENDAFIQDVVSGGYDVSLAGKHIGHFDEMNVALYNLKTETERSNYFPTIWFISDHGNYWPIDENGNEIKTSINERISPELFKSAINVSKERGTDNRTRKLGTLYFNNFIGKPLIGGIISNIHVTAPQQGNYRNVRIEITYEYKNAPVVPDSLKNSYITYDIDKDLYDVDTINHAIDRKDARILSLIALQINPNSKYKESGRYFNIKGLNENFERNREIASTIINQLGGMGKLNAMTGAYNFVAVENGVSFKIKNRSANYIKIVLNGKDLYDVEIGRISGTNYKIIKKQEDVYVEDLKKLIEDSTGMYLSLFENKEDESEKCYIEYLDASNKFRKTRKEFNNFEDAKNWGRNNISNFHIDMIKYNNLNENLDISSEIESEIENRFRPSDDMLSYSDMQDIANEYGVDFEDVLQMVQAYTSKRNQERNSDLTYWVKELISIYGYENNNEIPDWKTFYNMWKSEGFQEENLWANEQDVKNEFLKQTSNPNQLSLFENKLTIKYLIENQISEEEEYRNKLDELKASGKITLSIGNHGLIFMQILNSSDSMKSYNTYKEAYEYYLRNIFVQKANIAANAQHKMNKMVYKNQSPGYKFEDDLFKKYEREFIDNTEEIYHEDFTIANKLIMNKLNELSKQEGEHYYEWWLDKEQEEYFNND